MDYSKYIFPLDSTTDGSGVLVGNLRMLERNHKKISYGSRNFLMGNIGFLSSCITKQAIYIAFLSLFLHFQETTLKQRYFISTIQ